jgi:hypothetical protein
VDVHWKKSHDAGVTIEEAINLIEAALMATTDMQDEIDKSALQAILLVTKGKAREAYNLCAQGPAARRPSQTMFLNIFSVRLTS